MHNSIFTALGKISVGPLIGYIVGIGSLIISFLVLRRQYRIDKIAMQDKLQESIDKKASKAELNKVESNMLKEIEKLEIRDDEKHRIMQENHSDSLKAINSKLTFIENWIIKKTK